MRYGSVCSGIEAASVAWHPLGWTPAWFAEIEPFPCAVLNHHFPEVTNLGDMTGIASRIRDGSLEAPDVLVGGTPCQAFSVAGLRGGLDDPRGALTIAYVDLADAIDSARTIRGLPPTITVWENVPGVLSSKDNAFGCFLGALAGESCELQPPGGKWSDAGCVFGPQRAIAWRIIDAQYLGVAQRRRRVFVIASARDGFNPCEILFERDSVRRDTPPSRQAREEIAGTLASRTSAGGFPGTDESLSGYVQPVEKWPAEIASTLNAAFGSKLGLEDQHVNGGCPLFVPAVAFDAYQHHGWRESDTIGTLTANLARGICGDSPLVNQPAYGIPGNWIGRQPENGGNAVEPMHDVAPCLTGTDRHGVSYSFDPVAFAQNTRDEVREMAVVGALAAQPGMKQTSYIRLDMAVRRLTPRECERLQDFPDDYTLIPVKGKPAADGPRYKALGNSMAVCVMRWIGERIQMAESIK